MALNFKKKQHYLQRRKYVENTTCHKCVDLSWQFGLFNQLVLFNLESVCTTTFAFLVTCLELSSKINVLFHVTNPSLEHGFLPEMDLNQLFLKWMLASTIVDTSKKFCHVRIIYIFHLICPALSWKDNCHSWFNVLSFGLYYDSKIYFKVNFNILIVFVCDAMKNGRFLLAFEFINRWERHPHYFVLWVIGSVDIKSLLLPYRIFVTIPASNIFQFVTKCYHSFF